MRRKVVLASGVFDLLHYGHVRFLEEAKRQGGKDAKLVVIVARDRTVEKMKGGKPIVPEDQRRALVEALKVVDEAVLGYEVLNLDKVIERVRPDIIAVGYDQSAVMKELKELVTRRGYGTRVVRIGRFGKRKLNSSSKIKRKIIESYQRSIK